MKKRILLFSKYFLFWYLYFVLARLLFLFYHLNQSKSLGVLDWLNVIVHGFKLDSSTVGYIMIVPSLIIILTSFYKTRLLYVLMNCYTLILLVIIVFLTIVDLKLFSFWGFRLDSTPLLYLTDPKEMIASLSYFSLFVLLIIIVIIIVALFRFYKKWISDPVKFIDPQLYTLIIFPVLLAALIIPIRGGTGLNSVNVSSAYFSPNNFANQAAINCIWNLGYSISELGNVENNFIFLSDKKATRIVDSLYGTRGKTRQLLHNTRPNIIMIVVESFTAKAIESLNGLKGITPGFNQLVKEGVLFDHFYASGDRTDKAMVAILGSYPAFPASNIIKYPYKAGKLFYFTKDLKKMGYHTVFYYGGNPDFANYGILLNLAGFDKIISIRNFGKDGRDSKWGAWDHVVFNRMINETGDEDSLFFEMIFTLTSHPPYDLPVNPFMKGNDQDTKFLNSLHYTDSCISHFVEQAKKKKWWKNTLIIIVADHGVTAPGNTPNYAAEKFRIPMLWLGGALAVRDTVIHTFGVQTDISTSLLGQMGVQVDIPFSKDIFSEHVKSFSYYSFNNGFGYLTDSCHLIFDNIEKKYIVHEGHPTGNDLNAGKAILQVSYNDFLKK